jgi:hypothetical protein
MYGSVVVMKRVFHAAALAAGAVALCSFSHHAFAASVTYTQVDGDYSLGSLPTSFNPAPVTSTNTNFGVTGEVPGVARSPFENAAAGNGGTHLSDNGYGVGTWAAIPYTSIQAGGSATYNFPAPADSLSILWGSPDSYNTLSFYSGLNGTGTDLFNITGSALELQTYGHDLVDFTMTGGTFQSVVLTSSGNAFEFADLEDSPFINTALATPLPAALPLFAGGLGVIGVCARRRKRTIASPFAAA